MRILSLVLVTGLMITSCAKIPVQSVELADQIYTEGERMHRLNIALVNRLFSEKREKIDEFIRLRYTPRVLDNFVAQVPVNTDVKKELPGMMNSIIPRINERRDSMQAVLEANRIKIIDQLNQDFQQYQAACKGLSSLLQSAADVGTERKKVLGQISALSGNTLDFEQLETTIDQFIVQTGDWQQSVDQINKGISNLLGR